MNYTDKCPLPDLAEALEPYVRSRAEISQVRNAIDATLREEVGRPLSRTTLAIDAKVSRHADVTNFSGARSAYLKALLAHQKAQSQYKTLIKGIESLRDSGDGDASTQLLDRDRNQVLDQVSTIRQNHRLQKLNIIKRAFAELQEKHDEDSVAAAGADHDHEPSLPSHSSQQHMSTEAADEALLTLDLKKAVLRAQSLAKAGEAASVAADPGLISGQPLQNESPRTYALQRARDDLIGWLEDQLAKIADGESEDAVTDDDHPDQDATTTLESLRESIRSKYGDYVNARKDLVANCTPGVTEPVSLAVNSTYTADIPRQTTAGVDLSTCLIPHMASLRTASATESSLLQQSSFLRRLLSQEASDRRDFLSHMSEESHMVAPGTSDADAWTKSAQADRESTVEFITGRLAAGQDSIERARAIAGS